MSGNWNSPKENFGSTQATAKFIPCPLKKWPNMPETPAITAATTLLSLADIPVGSVGATDGWNSVFIRTEIGEEYFDMVREDMEIMEDPKPGLELVQKLIDTKRKANAKYFGEVRKEFSFETGIRNATI
jgi:hypothetical protein